MASYVLDGETVALMKPGNSCTALHDFNAKKEGDLSFTKGESLDIITYSETRGWYLANNERGVVGLVPGNLLTHVSHLPGKVQQEVKLHPMPWFHGNISRFEAEEMLKTREDGLFLIRDSLKHPYSLSMCFHKEVSHYQIFVADGDKVTIDRKVLFPILSNLVQYYQIAGGLKCRLGVPLQKEGVLEYSVNVDDFRTCGWTLRRDDLQLDQEIGNGDFNVVRKGQYLGKRVAVKSLKPVELVNSVPIKAVANSKTLKSLAVKTVKVFTKNSKTSKSVDVEPSKTEDRKTLKNRQKSLLAEAAVMTSLKHRNVIDMLGVMIPEPRTTKPVHLVLELMDKGSLLDILRSRGRKFISQSDLIGFARDISSAMVYLEEKNIVHRDLAARNVLVSREGVAKLADFGFAREAGFNLEITRFPVKWTAPEALKDWKKSSSKSDVWSFGIVLWEMWSFGQVPYPKVLVKDLVGKLMSGYRMDTPNGCPPHVCELMTTCWNIERRIRPSFKEISEQLGDHIRTS